MYLLFCRRPGSDNGVEMLFLEMIYVNINRNRMANVAHKGVGNIKKSIKMPHNFFEKIQIPPKLKKIAARIELKIIECKSEKSFFKYFFKRIFM